MAANTEHPFRIYCPAWPNMADSAVEEAMTVLPDGVSRQEAITDELADS
jgi:hypothetical protein